MERADTTDNFRRRGLPVFRLFKFCSLRGTSLGLVGANELLKLFNVAKGDTIWNFILGAEH